MAMNQVDRISTEKQFDGMLDVFEEAFDDSGNYGKSKRPSPPYIQAMLSNPDFIGLLARGSDGEDLGALAAYVLRKFEQERSEVYIYDLAVRRTARRKGVARSLIEALKKIAHLIGASSLYVQADKGEEDLPAQELYRSLGEQEDVFHYDLKLD